MPSIDNIAGRIAGVPTIDPRGDFYMSDGDVFYHQGYDEPSRDVQLLPLPEDTDPFPSIQEAFDYFYRTYGSYLQSLRLFMFLEVVPGNPYDFIDIRKQDDIDSELFMYQALDKTTLVYARTILEEFVNQIDVHYPTQYGTPSSFIFSEGSWTSISREEFQALSQEEREDVYRTWYEVEDIVLGDHPDAIRYVDISGGTSPNYDRRTYRYSVLGDVNALSC